MPQPSSRSLRRPANSGAQAFAPFQDRRDYLRALADAVHEHLAGDDAQDQGDGEFDARGSVPRHLRGRRVVRRAPDPRAGYDPRGAPQDPGASAVAVLKGRAAATRRSDRAFPWPHEELASAARIPRPLAAAAVILRVLEPDLHPAGGVEQAPEPERVADLAGRLLGVRRNDRARIVGALEVGGELARAGLVPFQGEDEELRFGPGPSFVLPRAVRRFVDGHRSPLEGTRLVPPGAVRPLDWMSECSAEEIRRWMAGRLRAQRLLEGGGLPAAALREGLGPLELTLPEGVPGEGLGGALASLLEQPVQDALARPGAPAWRQADVVAEARLRGAVLLVAGPEPVVPGPRGGLPGWPGPFDLEEEPWPTGQIVVRLGHGDAASHGIRLEPPDREVRAALWRRTLDALGEPAAEPGLLERLAEMPLHPEQIVASAGRHAMACSHPDRAAPTLLQAVGREVRAGGPSAEIPAVRLADVVMPDALRDEALQVLAACRDWRSLSGRLAGTAHGGYGHAPVVLASGPPGTGKTRLAEALAGELGRALRRLSGPDLRSCWVGEAEKQIRAEFRRDDDAVLFLDEVDAFLGERGSGPQARHDDQLANVLLEEIERTWHVVVMATNRPDGLDRAVDRRVLFRLEFEAPGPRERAALWRLHLPREIPGAAGVDCEALARHALAGGGIKNASWRAILRANRGGVDLSTELVEEEARREARRGGSRRASAGFGGIGR